MPRTIVLIIVGFFGHLTSASIALAAPPHAADSKLAPAVLRHASDLVDEGRPAESVALIVQTWTAPDQEVLHAVDAAGGRPGRIFTSVHAFAAEVPAGNVIELARNPGVRRLSLDGPVEPFQDLPGATPFGSFLPWGDAGYAGAGVTVAILDSGVSPTPDLEPLLEVDLIEEDGVPADYFGHGTHVAGIIAGTGEASSCRSCYRTFRGLAPAARVVSVKVLDGRGRGTVGSVLAGIDFVIRNHEALGIRVMNLSLGHRVDESYETDPLCRAVEEAWRAGIVVVAAAGNSGGAGNATIASPGNDPLVITAGAAEGWGSPETTDDIVAAFSSLGPTSFDGVIKPDILAPGTGVVSLRSPGSLLDEVLAPHVLRLSSFMTDPPAGDGASTYISMSGTSTAAAAVSAAAAILLSQDPHAKPEDIKARLLVGARKLNDAIVARGAGLLDVAASLQLGASGVSAEATPSPRLRLAGDAANRPFLVSLGVAWGDAGAWRSSMVWGETGTWGTTDSWMLPEVWSEPEHARFAGGSGDEALPIWQLR